MDQQILGKKQSETSLQNIAVTPVARNSDFLVCARKVLYVSEQSSPENIFSLILGWMVNCVLYSLPIFPSLKVKFSGNKEL